MPAERPGTGGDPAAPPPAAWRLAPPQHLGVAIPERARGDLTARLELETDAIDRLQRGVALCVAEAYKGSRQLLETILTGEEEHADWLETQLELVRQLGEAFYLTQQVRS